VRLQRDAVSGLNNTIGSGIKELVTAQARVHGPFVGDDIQAIRQRLQCVFQRPRVARKLRPALFGAERESERVLKRRSIIIIIRTIHSVRRIMLLSCLGGAAAGGAGAEEDARIFIHPVKNDRPWPAISVAGVVVLLTPSIGCSSSRRCFFASAARMGSLLRMGPPSSYRATARAKSLSSMCKRQSEQKPRTRCAPSRAAAPWPRGKGGGGRPAALAALAAWASDWRRTCAFW
jgi:hypothetical protein